MKNILILGLGNLLMDDDAAGVIAVNQLKEELPETEHLKIIDGGTLGLDLLSHIGWADKLIIIDAIDMDFEPGTIIKAEGHDIDPIFESKLSPHQMGLKDLLLAAELTGDRPKEVVLFGIQVESIQMNMRLSKKIEKNIQKLKTHIIDELNQSLNIKEVTMINFTKMSGSGNDFIIIDNRDGKISYNKNFIEKVCRRSLSVGADGIIFIEKSDKADFKWAFFNSDGSVAEMCGNGSRCAAKFAYMNNIAGKEMKFETLAGIIEAEIKEDTNVKVQLTRPFDEKLSLQVDTILLSFINTGVPHAVVKVDNIDDIDIIKTGSFLRYHDYFKPAGTNVDFYEVVDNQTVKMRTYERGVEGETLACGTGAAAVAIIASKNDNLKSPIKVITRSGLILKIYLENNNVYLEGEARVIYKGILDKEAYEY